MKTIANANDGTPNEWDDGTLSAPSADSGGGLNFGSVFVVGLLIASAIGGAVAVEQRK